MHKVVADIIGMNEQVGSPLFRYISRIIIILDKIAGLVYNKYASPYRCSLTIWMLIPWFALNLFHPCAYRYRAFRIAFFDAFDKLF